MPILVDAAYGECVDGRLIDVEASQKAFLLVGRLAAVIGEAPTHPATEEGSFRR